MTKDVKNTVWRDTESEGCEMGIAWGQIFDLEI